MSGLTIDSGDLLALRIRNLIAAREFNTAAAQFESTHLNGWQTDHGQYDRELANEIDELFKKANVPVSSGAEAAPYAQAAGADDRCPTCRRRNSRAGDREMDDGSVIVWHCNVPGCANHADYPNKEVDHDE